MAKVKEENTPESSAKTGIGQPQTPAKEQKLIFGEPTKLDLKESGQCVRMNL